jgi:adenylate kinase family enzyme
MIAGERWVIDGMKLGVLDERLAAADAAVFLNLSRWRCRWGVLLRRFRYRGALRPEIGVYDRVNVEFIRWLWSFRATARPPILTLLRSAPCEVTILRSRRETCVFLDSLAPPPGAAA